MKRNTNDGCWRTDDIKNHMYHGSQLRYGQSNILQLLPRDTQLTIAVLTK